MIRWFIESRVAPTFLLIAILIAAVFSFQFISTDAFPDREERYIDISVAYPGSSPETSELGVAVHIEDALENLPGAEQIDSYSYQGGVSVYIKMLADEDPQRMLNEVKMRIDEINTFPPSAERPVVRLYDYRNKKVTTFIVYGNVSEIELMEQAKQIRDELRAMPTIGAVEFLGTKNYEVAIEPSAFSLAELNLTIADLSRIINQSALDVSAGTLHTEAGDIVVQTRAKAYNRSDLENIIVARGNDGGLLKLGDIATIRDGFEFANKMTLVDGYRTVSMQVDMVGVHNIVGVSESIAQYIEERQQTMPQGVYLTEWQNRAQYVNTRIDLMIKNAIQGGILVLVILSIFLRPSVALWVLAGIPVSVLGSFIIMAILGITFNTYTILAFILILGIVVDDAIVTAEHIHRRLLEPGGKSVTDIITKATQEISQPVTLGVVTTIVAFVPLLLLPGNSNLMFRAIPAVVIPVLIFSLIESKLILPSHLKSIKADAQNKKRFFTLPEHANAWLNKIAHGYYARVLKVCMSAKLIVMAGFLSVTCLSYFMVSEGHVRFSFDPGVEAETVRLYLTMPADTPYSLIEQHGLMITKHAESLRDKYIDAEGNSVVTKIVTGMNPGLVYVRFTVQPPEERSLDITGSQLANEWRDLVGVIPGAESLTLHSMFRSGGRPIQVELKSSDFLVLDQASHELEKFLSNQPGVHDIEDNFGSGKTSIALELKPLAHFLGLSLNDIMTQIRHAYYGLQTQRIQRGGDDVRMMIRLPQDERTSFQEMNNLLILTPTGARMPLSELAELKFGKSPLRIARSDGKRTKKVWANIDGAQVNMLTMNQDIRAFMNDLQSRYPSMTFKLRGDAENTAETIDFLFWSLLGVLFVIYALLGIVMNSFFQPLTVLLSVPFCALGALWGHVLLGVDLSIYSLLGMMALVGIVMNDSLVIVDRIRYMPQSLPLRDQIIEASASRFRAVFLTSITTFIGLLPLILEKATQAQALIPIAISLGFGVLLATPVTLILTPMFYEVTKQVTAYFGLEKAPAAQQSV